MTIVTLYPSSNTVDAGATGGWTNPQNAYADDTAYATAAPSSGVTYANFFGTFGADSAIPAGATINSVTLNLKGFQSSANNNDIWGWQSYISGVAFGTETTRSDIGTTDTVMSSAALTTLTRADLLNGVFTVRARFSKSSGVGIRTASLNLVSVTVDYTPPLATTGSQRAALHHVRTRAIRERIDLYHVRRTALRDRNASYDVRTRAARSPGAAAWGVRASRGAQRLAPFAIRIRAARAKEAPYAVRLAVGSGRAGLYRLLARAGLGRSASFGLLTFVSGGRSGSWDARMLRGAAKMLSWDIRTVVNRQVRSSYDAFARVPTGRETFWNARLLKGWPVGTTWNVLDRANRGREILWGVLTRRGAQETVLWTTLARVNSEGEVSWDVLVTNIIVPGLVSSDRRALWRVRLPAAGQAAPSWISRGRAMGAKTTSWAIRGALGRTFPTLWMLRSLARGEHAVLYTVRSPRSAGRQASWAALAFTRSNRGASWEVLTELLPVVGLERIVLVATRGLVGSRRMASFEVVRISLPPETLPRVSGGVRAVYDFGGAVKESRLTKGVVREIKMVRRS